MAIEYHAGQNGDHRTIATACPYCEEEIAEQESLATHIDIHCDEVHK